MKIACLMPYRNKAQFLPKTIQMVKEQTRTDFDFLLSDDGSTDGSREIAKASAEGAPFNVIHLEHEPSERFVYGTAGYLGHLNWIQSLFADKYDIFLSCCADDMNNPARVEKTIKFMEETSAAYVGSNVVYRHVNPDGTWQDAGMPWHQGPSRMIAGSDVLRGNSPLPGTTMSYRTDLWREFGPLPIPFGVDDMILPFRGALVDGGCWYFEEVMQVLIRHGAGIGSGGKLQMETDPLKKLALAEYMQMESLGCMWGMVDDAEKKLGPDNPLSLTGRLAIANIARMNIWARMECSLKKAELLHVPLKEKAETATGDEFNNELRRLGIH